MIKRILSDYRHNLKANGKDFASEWLLYYWLYDYNMLILEHSEKGLLITVSRAILIMLFAYVGGFCPIIPEKTMYLCPISQKGLKKYLHTQYLLKIIPCTILLLMTALSLGYFRLSYGWVWTASVWLFILLVNTRVSHIFYQNRKIVYDRRYRILKVLAWIAELLAFWFHDMVWTIYTGSGAARLPIGALFLIPSFIYTGMTVYLFWKNVCKKMGNYELVYQYIQKSEGI